MPKRSSEDELFARIAQSPDDDSNYMVYADVLASAGDPQGELIALMYQLATAEHDRDDARRAQLGAGLDAYLVEHRARLFGELAKHAGIAWDFQLGFLRSVAVVPDVRDDAAALVTQILELPIARVVRELVVFVDTERRRPPIADAVAAAKPQTLACVVFATKYTAIPEGAERAAVRWFELPYAAGATAFPAELLELTNVELLELTRTRVAAIPSAIGALHRLRRLDISWCNELEDLPEELFGIETLSYIQMYDCFGLRNAFHMGRVNHLLSGFVRARTPSRRRIVETNLFLGRDRRALELASDTDLLASLDNNVAAVRDSALRCLATRVPDRLGEPLAKGSSFALIGKTNFDKARIAVAVTDRGAALTTKITDATTHVIVGSQPGGKQTAIGDRVIVLDAHLKTLLAPSAKRGTASLDDMRTALRSRDEARTLNAIAGLDGELPPELCADVVVVAIDVKLKKSREAAKKLLATAAPASVVAALKTHLKQSLLLESMGETKRTDRIIAFCRAAKVIDPLALAEVLVARARVGLGYLFAHGTPAAITRALEARVANGALDLHLAEIAAVPSQVSALASVVELDLSQNHLTRWPEPVLAMPELERLDLSSNRIARVPDAAGALRLTALDLGRNRMRQFPMAVLNMATLVELDISNSQEYVDDEARITGLPEQIGALHRLERFRYRFQIVEAFPDELFALPELAELDLMMCTLPETIPPRLAELASLTQLDLRYSTWASRAPAIR